MARQVHTLQFKQQAVAMTREPDATVAGVARSLGISAQSLRYWIDHPPGATQRRRGRGTTDAAGDASGDDPAALKLRLKEAEARIRRLEMEREILKKATAYFANQHP
jgi:transposase